MSPRKKAHGKGATVSCLIKFLHPSQLIRNTYPNPENGQRLEGCLTIRQEVKKINCKDQLAIVVKHDDFVGMDKEPQELYAVKKHFSIQVEGDPDFFFNVSLVQEDGEEELDQQEVLPAAVNDELMGQNHSRQNDLVVALTGLMDVDDNNEPVPENILVPPAPPPPSVLSQEWGHDGFFLQKSNNLPDAKAKLVYLVDTTRNDINLQLFECFSHRAFMEDVMIAETNKILDQHPLSYGELLCWIGLWVLISMVDGSNHQSFWSTKKINMYECMLYHLSSYMTWRCFKEILSAL